MQFAFTSLRGSFALKIIVTLCLIAFGDWIFYQGGYFGAAIGGFGLLILVGMVIALPHLLHDRRSILALILASLFAASMIYDASLLGFLLFFTAAVAALILPRSARSDDVWQWFQRMVYHGLVSLIAPISDSLRWLSARRARGGQLHSVRQIVPMVALPIGGTIIFLWLFTYANPVIANWFGSITLLNLDVFDILRLILWGFLLWSIWMLMRAHVPSQILSTFDARGDVYLPGVTPGSVLLSLVMFNAVFLIQNSMDAAWLWAGVSLPEEFTLAEYAHRGAYPLIATALLAGAFVLVALRPGSTTASMPAIRILVGLWTLQNVFLVFNAALRTLNYINAYSLTVLRIEALIWMGLVALGLVLILWRMLKDKSTSWLLNTNAAAAGLALAIVCFVDLGAIAAQWNVRHAREVDGDGAVLDLCYLNSLGGSALIPLIELEQSDIPPQLKERVHNVRILTHSWLQQSYKGHSESWGLLNRWRLQQAEEMLGEAAPSYQRGSDISCDGTPYSIPDLPVEPYDASEDDTSLPPEPILDDPSLTEAAKE